VYYYLYGKIIAEYQIITNHTESQCYLQPADTGEHVQP